MLVTACFQQTNIPYKFPIKPDQKQYAIYGHSSHGPSVGGAQDFHLFDNFNTRNDNYSQLGSCYDAPKDNNMLAGVLY